MFVLKSTSTIRDIQMDNNWCFTTAKMNTDGIYQQPAAKLKIAVPRLWQLRLDFTQRYQTFDPRFENDVFNEMKQTLYSFQIRSSIIRNQLFTLARCARIILAFFVQRVPTMQFFVYSLQHHRVAPVNYSLDQFLPYISTFCTIKPFFFAFLCPYSSSFCTKIKHKNRIWLTIPLF